VNNGLIVIFGVVWFYETSAKNS